MAQYLHKYPTMKLVKSEVLVERLTFRSQSGWMIEGKGTKPGHMEKRGGCGAANFGFRKSARGSSFPGKPPVVTDASACWTETCGTSEQPHLSTVSRKM